MALIEKKVKQMLKEVGRPKMIRHDILSPKDNPDIFTEVLLGHGLPFFRPSSTYVQSISDLTKIPYRIINEVFLNAFGRGNRGQADLPVSVRVFEGRKGRILRIRDSGAGFDYKGALNRKKNGEVYYQNSGFGLNLLDESSEVQASYEGDGSVINLHVKYSLIERLVNSFM